MQYKILKFGDGLNYDPVTGELTSLEATPEEIINALGAAPVLDGDPRILTLGETDLTAHRGDLGKTAYEHSQLPHAPSNAQKNSDITKEEIEAKLVGEVESHSHPGSEAAYEHSQSPHAPSNAQKNSTITKEEIEAKLVGEVESHSHPGSEPAYAQHFLLMGA